ncbi:MAG: MBL fold metallo-hydrolase [Clostridia bacterium]|nr:MBL fold metallo-hydrolase [Clostridia bacterium]
MKGKVIMQEKTFTIGLGGYRMLQAPNTTITQMMSYLIVTPNRKLIVIDGGLREDAAYLSEKIHAFGSVVSLWIITHIHYDHYDALVEILEKPDQNGITIEKICYHFPPQEWVDAAEPRFIEPNKACYDILDKFRHITFTANENDQYEIDGLIVDIMKTPVDYLDYDPDYTGGSTVNDTSIVFKLLFPNGKSALFLGDLGLRAGTKLAMKFKDKLKSDIVQMAHHGQNGAGEDVYQYVKPDLCMWTAPIWLYDNNGGLLNPELENAFNNHHFKTVIVRGWMEKLGMTMHAVEGEGPAWII